MTPELIAIFVAVVMIYAFGSIFYLGYWHAYQWKIQPKWKTAVVLFLLGPLGWLVTIIMLFTIIFYSLDKGKETWKNNRLSPVNIPSSYPEFSPLSVYT